MDRKPDEQCTYTKAADSQYCKVHQEFPNLGKALLKYAREHGAGFQVEDFMMECYPDATGTPSGDLNALAESLLNASSSSNSAP